MTAPAFKLQAGACPYHDGSGYQVTAVVEAADEGVMLSFDVVYRIPVDDWPAVRAMIDHLVASAKGLPK